ncbi:UNVERIFIED_CONTAM: hypothetical protein FKN15_034930 [Acipenser sinensis]
MGKHDRRQQQQVWREVPEHPQPRREETEPFPSSEEMLDWVSDPEWNWEDLPKVVDLLWARDGEHWEHWEQHYYPVPFVNPAAVVINYLAADMGLPQQVDFQVGGATPTCTLTGLEGKCLLSPSPPAEGKCLLILLLSHCGKVVSRVQVQVINNQTDNDNPGAMVVYL